jgi:hypothetical protein
MKKITIVSYYSNLSNSVLSEWLKDKVNTLLILDYKVHLITSTENPKLHLKGLKVTRIPALAPSIYFRELFQSFNRNLGIHLLFFPIMITIGVFIEILERIIFKRIGFGFWSWTPSVFIVLAFFNLIKKDLIISTGGPAASHLAVSTFGFLFNKRTIIELQDPLVGVDIGHNNKSRVFFKFLEKYLVKTCSKLVFVTEAAFDNAKARYPNEENINWVYSSSRKFKLNFTKSFQIKDKVIKLLHLGSLYSTRNLRELLKPLNELLCDELREYTIEIHNYGSLGNFDYPSFSEKIKILDFPPLIREEAISKINHCTGFLLIQHSDSRSNFTIPYKTWDYLNTGMPIFSLINSLELNRLLDAHGQIAANIKSDIDIKNKFLNWIHNYDYYYSKLSKNSLSIENQVKILIELEF